MITKVPTLSVMALATGMLAGQAQTNTATTTTPVAPPSPALEQTIQDIKHPVKWLSWGADFRARDESFDNLLTLNQHDVANLHEQNYLRFRARVWASVMPVDDISFNVRLSDETREWLSPAGYTAFSPRPGYDWREGIFDTLNVQWRNIAGQPLAATVGRQDILLGDGWLTGDGTPFDGSWTYYLDAARVAYELKDQKTTIEAIGIMQDAMDEGWLPTINNQDLYETEQNEKGAILWVANKSLPVANLDGYFFYKEDRAANGLAPKFRADNAYIYTPGARVSGVVAEHWKYSAEGAYQFGRKQDPSVQYPEPVTGFRSINAFGVNSRLTYMLKDEWNNQFSLSYEFLSGDDPNTKNDEMFDNLWGRWPRWSEIGLYSFAAETRIGNEANLHRVGPTWSFNPTKAMEVNLSYFALLSQYEIATRGPRTLFAGNDGLSDAGTFRGHFLQAVLKYKFSKHLSGHLWGEVEMPGDYYVHRATWYFLRPEIMLTF